VLVELGAPAIACVEPALDWAVLPAELAVPPFSAEPPSVLLWQAAVESKLRSSRDSILLAMNEKRGQTPEPAQYVALRLKAFTLKR
jgi:hypothetical protein